MNGEAILQEETEGMQVPVNDTGDGAPETEEKIGTSGGVRGKIPAGAVEFAIRVAATVLTVWLSLTFLFGIYVCHSDACYPMVKDGDLCVTWRPTSPGQGDLVAYEHNGEIKFGRVAAVAGDRVDIRDGVVWVNGYVATAETLPDAYDLTITAKFPLTVPDNSLFLLSDNISDTNDSRSFGALPLGDCRGSVVFLMRRRGF